MAADSGAEAPANKSTKILCLGRGAKSKDGRARAACRVGCKDLPRGRERPEPAGGTTGGLRRADCKVGPKEVLAEEGCWPEDRTGSWGKRPGGLEDGAGSAAAGGGAAGRVSSEEEREHTDPERTDSTSGPSQCFVDRCSNAVCFCAHGLPLASGTGQRCDRGQLGSVHLPRAPRIQTSMPLIFLCQDLSNALAAGTWLEAVADVADLALAFGRPG